MAEAEFTDEGIEQFRPYLQLLARKHLDPRLQGKVDASDIVQQTMLEAHAGRDGFRGETTAQQAAWLRQILARNLANIVRDLGRAKRDIARERSLEAALDESSAGLHYQLAADQSTPSAQAQRHEQAVQIAMALAQLPEPQREVILLRHWHGWSVAEISKYLDRSPAAVAGLLHRGLKQLRTLLQPPP